MQPSISSINLLKAISSLREAKIKNIPTKELVFFDEPVLSPHTEQDIRSLVKSISHGIVQPIFVNTSYLVIDGEGRVKAAVELDVETVPCKILDAELDEKDLIRLRALLNPLNDVQDWAHEICGKHGSDSIVERAKNAQLALRRRRTEDLTLQRLQDRHDYTATEIAMTAVNCIRGIDSIRDACDKGILPENLVAARSQLTEAIKNICHPLQK